jgi:hypothetical protein
VIQAFCELRRPFWKSPWNTPEALKASDRPGRVPQHIAIIMDGNGRWAKRQGEHRVVGHANGVRPCAKPWWAATEVGVKYLTLYAFSTENWNRPQSRGGRLDGPAGEDGDEANWRSSTRTAFGCTPSGTWRACPESCRQTLREAMAARQERPHHPHPGLELQRPVGVGAHGARNWPAAAPAPRPRAIDEEP